MNLQVQCETLLFAGPCFRETTTLNIFTRLYFQNWTYLVLTFIILTIGFVSKDIIFASVRSCEIMQK